MTTMKREISNLLKIHQGLPGPKLRRQHLHQQMDELKANNINCFSCVGHCCTFESNSMQVTPQEALDVLAFLDAEGRINQELISSLEETVRKYRLDKEISTGRNSTFRRTYTCTFYKPGEKGCTLSKEDKPYGCLAFNALEIQAHRLDQCRSSQEDLKVQDEMNQDEILAQKLKDELSLSWTKLPLPVALLEFIGH